MKISEDLVNKVYDILVEAGASENMRSCFVYAFSSIDGDLEWRFEGKLGFGGKLWYDWFYIDDRPNFRVSCYSEDETPERLQIISDTNEKLRKLTNDKAV